MNHALLHPQQHDPPPLLPERLPGGRVPVEVVDVLVALGRVLRVLERAVGTALEPLRVLGQPRVVGGRVEREVQSRRPCRARCAVAHSERDVVHRAQLGMDGVVAALLRADRVRRAGIVRAGLERVVRALAVLAADRVDRQQVEHVEAVLGDLRGRGPRRPSGRPRSAGTARTRTRSARARGRPRSPAASRCGGVVALAVAARRRREVGRQRGVEPRARPRPARRAGASSARSSTVRSGAALGAGRGVLEQQRALGELAGEVVLAGVDLALQLVAPGREESLQASIVHSQRPGVSTANDARPADAVVWASTRASATRSSRRPR